MTTKRPLDKVIQIACLAMILAMTAIALGVYRADGAGLLIFAGFIVFYVQLPGQLLIRLAGIRFEHTPGILASGFFTGWAFVVLQYFITEVIPSDLILYITGPLCSVIYLAVLAVSRKKDDLQRLDRGRWLSPSFCFFVVLCLLYSMMLTQYLYLSPTVDQTITMNPDKGFHLGLINSLSHGYPLECPWFAGLYFNYHIFTELLYSVPIRLFGLTADTLLFTCGPYMTVYAFGMSLYAFFCEMCRRRERAGLYCLAVILSNIFIARGIDRSIAFLFIFRNENVAGYGISCAMVVIILLHRWYERSENKPAAGPFLVLLALVMLNTGIKGPFGIVLLAAMWGTFVLGLILRKVRFRTILPLILLSAGFYVVYAIILGSKGQSASAGESLIGMANIINITFYKAPLIALMKSLGLPSVVRYAVLLGAFTVCLLTAFFLPFVIGYLRELFLVLTGRKDFDFTRIVVYAAALVGFIAMMLLNYHGHSQIYFGFVTVFFAPLIAFWFFEDMEDDHGFLMKLVRFLFIAALALSAAGLGSFLYTQSGEAIESADPAAHGNKYKSMSHEEYQAMRWIDENTPKDALLATDRYYSVAPEKFDVVDRWDNRFFLYADYSNRICYLAGAGYNLPAREWQKRLDRIRINDRLFDPADPDRGDLARELGIDYVVLSKRFTHVKDLSNRDYRVCYKNKDIIVYEITE